MPILSHSPSASGREWVVNTIPPSLILILFCKVVQRNFLAIGSMPLEGSSKNYKVGFPINASVVHNFLLFPPLSWSGFLFTYVANYMANKVNKVYPLKSTVYVIVNIFFQILAFQSFNFPICFNMFSNSWKFIQTCIKLRTNSCM